MALQQHRSKVSEKWIVLQQLCAEMLYQLVAEEKKSVDQVVEIPIIEQPDI